MSSDRPFIDRSTGAVDTDQLLVEAVPLAKLIGVFVAVALVPFALSFFLVRNPLGVILSILGQFVLAVGAGVVLMYVISRGMTLASE